MISYYIQLLHTSYRSASLILGFLAVIFLGTSCSTTKPSAYFTTIPKDTTIQQFVTNNYESKIVAGDVLSVLVSSLSTEEDAIFNKPITALAAAGSNPTTAGYLVQPDGSIFLHRLGKITAAGTTRKVLALQIAEQLRPFMKEPIVQVNYVNHKVTILGEVGKAQVLQLPEEQISIIDALVLSGDINASGNRKDVMVIREEGNTKSVKHLNLEDAAIFTSPWYYVKPNDIVLVSADNSKFRKEENRRNLQTNITLVATGLSLLIIIIDRVIK
ncbi:polysaccharide biosynthesis/export family protein [Ferruginibacter yonginensis]|uniref:Polysaccharide biosynthesis/export family protein n=1 Tax=Ferruginibacter yonginensis TaxID=1310416 RepID=A0ABV8QM98_9BACT